MKMVDRYNISYLYNYEIATGDISLPMHSNKNTGKVTTPVHMKK